MPHEKAHDDSERGGGTATIPGRSVVLIAISILICWAAAMNLERPILRDALMAEPAARIDMRIDINRASVADLPTIGPRLAERIVDDRDENGPFSSLADLARVRGIGPATIERISSLAVAR
jgi:competence ComEA-like helix-hairpin-helix protein